ncbi:AP2 domain-containing protein [Rhodoferax fermentans]|uniref:AP2/ERF domain-containing protein n=1 Tax=Rhodoferax fermentans TaxID=28066 RepID=A0A1T1ANU6_RHOFE|nr:AP2 domain-containing protein [Rhodoferax fermentans]OOV05801.1 hypothetical protein RF819_02920 [Rhodoferax fermentans]
MANRTYHERGKLIQGFPCKKHPLYNTWVLMRQRCDNPNNPAYRHYGGRGITVCERWQSFENFALDMGMKPSQKHSLEREDNDKGYSPENCKWETVEAQRLNRRCFVTSESGHTGVRQIKPGCFQAMVHINKVRYILGKFKTIEEAVAARTNFIANKAGKAQN